MISSATRSATTTSKMTTVSQFYIYTLVLIFPRSLTKAKNIQSSTLAHTQVSGVYTTRTFFTRRTKDPMSVMQATVLLLGEDLSADRLDGEASMERELRDPADDLRTTLISPEDELVMSSSVSGERISLFGEGIMWLMYLLRPSQFPAKQQSKAAGRERENV